MTQKEAPPRVVYVVMAQNGVPASVWRDLDSAEEHSMNWDVVAYERIERPIDKAMRNASDSAELARQCHYVSTYCIHYNHSDCRATCKMCGAPCLCRCHKEDANE